MTITSIINWVLHPPGLYLVALVGIIIFFIVKYMKE